MERRWKLIWDPQGKHIACCPPATGRGNARKIGHRIIAERAIHGKMKAKWRKVGCVVGVIVSWHHKLILLWLSLSPPDE
jgi:hypothetical protein